MNILKINKFVFHDILQFYIEMTFHCMTTKYKVIMLKLGHLIRLERRGDYKSFLGKKRTLKITLSVRLSVRYDSLEQIRWQTIEKSSS